MIVREVNFGKEAREELVKGVNILANAVRSTLGPKGRTVILASTTGRQVITKDGVSVAKHITLGNPKQQVGAQLIRDVASQACDAAGDGTTTATVLAQSIVNKGVELLTAGIDPIGLKKGVDLATADVLRLLRANARPVDNYTAIRSVARISANGDDDIAGIIADALSTVTTTGVVVINEGSDVIDRLDYVTGLTYDSGYLNNGFINSTAQGAWYIAGNVHVVVVGDDLEDMTLATKIVENYVDVPMMILAPSFGEDVARLFQTLVTRNRLNICPVKMPGFGSRAKDAMRDICAFTDAKIILAPTDIVGSVGIAFNAVVKRNTFTIGAAATVPAEYIQELEERAAAETGTQKKFVEDRIARLKGQIATITVGGSSEVDVKERKDRYDDAVNAARSAIATGVLPGGGIALLNAASQLTPNYKGAVQYGYELLQAACAAPLRQIATNAGARVDVIVDTIEQYAQYSWGWDASNDTYGDMFDLGIIDPAAVTISAITYAASVAGLILTTDCVITDVL